jgi:hypothetical protein
VTVSGGFRDGGPPVHQPRPIGARGDLGAVVQLGDEPSIAVAVLLAMISVIPHEAEADTAFAGFSHSRGGRPGSSSDASTNRSAGTTTMSPP